MLIGGMAAAGVDLTTLTPSALRNNMRFDLHQNVMCLAYEDPLLLERSRGWTPKNHFQPIENPQRPQPENGRAGATIEPEDFSRFEIEGSPETPVPAAELIALPLENAAGWRSAAP